MSQQNAARIRVIHRYLGFFLAGIMSIYAISGMVLIFRNTDFLKQKETVTKQVAAQAAPHELGGLLGLKRLEIKEISDTEIIFDNGSYNKATGEAKYTVQKLPYLLDKMTGFHKATTGDPLYYFNLFFGGALLFFALSSFWMFMPASPIFKKGLYFTLGGVVLALLLLFL